MVYGIGLTLVILFVLLSIDDIIWDLYSVWRWMVRPNAGQNIAGEALDAALPKLLAVVVAAWQEEDVLAGVIDNLIRSNQYPRSMYHVFLAVYPNDGATQKVAYALSDRHSNVHVLENGQPGPTSKAQNLNQALGGVYAYEAQHGCRFEALIVHDAEDVVHPDEFKLENYLLQQYPAVQMPVFPLQQMPRWRNFFKNLTSGTYADEFAENHLKNMVARDSLRAFVPSAGTGFALSREILDAFKGEDLFPEGSMTEDYKLALTLKQKGYHLHYILEQVVRVNQKGQAVGEYISTRSMFPATFRAAVKQKTRWIYGITLQSFALKEVLFDKRLDAATKYSLYKDWKAKFSNLITMPAYGALAYFILSLFVPLIPMYPAYSLSWWLCVCLTAMMLERQGMRAAAMKRAYGWRSMFFSCVVPPLLPLRVVYGNLINFTATCNAWKRYLGGGQKKTKRKQAWQKTQHTFLSAEVLRRYQRTLGDVLLEKELLDPDTLARALAKGRATGQRLGTVLRQENLVTETDLLAALAAVQHTQFVAMTPDMIHPPYFKVFTIPLLEQLGAAPLLYDAVKGWAFAVSDDTDPLAVMLLKHVAHSEIQLFFSTTEHIRHTLEKAKGITKPSASVREMETFLSLGQVEFEQALLAWQYAGKQGGDPAAVLKQMGLCQGPAYLPQKSNEISTMEVQA